MKHLKGFNEGINFNDLLDDSYGDGIEDIRNNAVFIEKSESCWGEDRGYYEGTMCYNIYLGPCDMDNCLSDSIGFTDDFLNSVLQASGVNRYHLHSSENSHTLYFSNDQEANDCYNELEEIISSYGFMIINDN